MPHSLPPVTPEGLPRSADRRTALHRQRSRPLRRRARRQRRSPLPRAQCPAGASRTRRTRWRSAHRPTEPGHAGTGLSRPRWRARAWQLPPLARRSPSGRPTQQLGGVVRTTPAQIRRNDEIMTFLWILLGHRVHGVLDLLRPGDVPQGALLAVLDRFFLPFLWIIGALIAPTERAAGRAAAGVGASRTAISVNLEGS